MSHLIMHVAINVFNTFDKWRERFVFDGKGFITRRRIRKWFRRRILTNHH